MIDDRVILEVGASVPVFRRPGPVYAIEPPGQFVGSVLKTARGYEAWRYPTRHGQPFAVAATLAEAVEAFAIRTSIPRPRSHRFGVRS